MHKVKYILHRHFPETFKIMIGGGHLICRFALRLGKYGKNKNAWFFQQSMVKLITDSE
jgi:hypothetical protein